MCGIAFYGSFASVCKDEGQNMRVSSFKSFFDTITYCIVYALVPLILDGLQMFLSSMNTLIIGGMGSAERSEQPADGEESDVTSAF